MLACAACLDAPCVPAQVVWRYTAQPMRDLTRDGGHQGQRKIQKNADTGGAIQYSAGRKWLKNDERAPEDAEFGGVVAEKFLRIVVRRADRQSALLEDDAVDADPEREDERGERQQIGAQSGVAGMQPNGQRQRGGE